MDVVVGLMQEHLSKNVFQSKGCREIDEALQVILLVVSEGMNVRMIKMFTFKEVKKIVFSLGKDKALGLDGFSGTFYHRHQKYIGENVFVASIFFFKNGFFPLSINATGMALVPKVSILEFPSQFRLIALCNFFIRLFQKCQ